MPPIAPVIPVLDLMIGQVVLARGGTRDCYRPVNSKLCRSSRPLDVAKSIQAQTGCDTFYLADIDSFAGAEPSWRIYNQLIDAGLRIWIDAAWLQGHRVEKLRNQVKARDRVKIIISSENLQNLEQLQTIATLQQFGFETIFGLDQNGNQVITPAADLIGLPPLEWVSQACQCGLKQLALTDISAVGTLQGIRPEGTLASLIREIRDELPDLCLISGGGVRSPEDVGELLSCGCNHVLVASAIHECRFTHDDIARLGQSLESPA